MDKRFSITLDDASLQELDYLGRRFGISALVSRSQLIREVISRCYLSEVEAATDPPTDPPKWHGFPDCVDDCDNCPDDFICDHSHAIDKFII